MDIISMIQAIPGLLHGKAADEQSVANAENELGLKFSAEYRAYLLNFGIAAFSGHELTGLTGSARTNVVAVTKAQRIQQPSIPADCYAVEEANIDGIVVWQNASGCIYVTSPNKTPHMVHKSLQSYLTTDSSQ